MPSVRNSGQVTAAGVACPICGGALAASGRSARCEAGHSFDFARSGYLNLASGGGGGRVGDSREMVRAREEFLAAGHYEPLAGAVAEAAREAVGQGGAGDVAGEGASEGERPRPVLAEIGAGTGYYLDAVARALEKRDRGKAGEAPGSDPGGPAAVGVDLSKAAADRAAKLHPERLFLVADVEDGIPLRDGAADLCLSVFAPRPAAELGRVTQAGGALVVALAGPRHLARLRERLELLAVGEDKLERLRERLAPWFEPEDASAVEWELSLSPKDARHLVLMGPNARHDPDLAALADGLDDLASVTVATFRRRLSR